LSQFKNTLKWFVATVSVHESAVLQVGYDLLTARAKGDVSGPLELGLITIWGMGCHGQPETIFRQQPDAAKAEKRGE
jgi:hypothetical protein